MVARMRLSSVPTFHQCQADECAALSISRSSAVLRLCTESSQARLLLAAGNRGCPAVASSGALASLMIAFRSTEGEVWRRGGDDRIRFAQRSDLEAKAGW